MCATCAHSVSKPCPTLCNLMDCSLPGSSVYEMFQARMDCHFLLQVLILAHIKIRRRNGDEVGQNQVSKFEMRLYFWIVILTLYLLTAFILNCKPGNLASTLLLLLLLLLLLSHFSRVRLCNPKDGSPPGSPVPGILQARTLEWVAISFSNAWEWKVKVKSLSRVWLLATPWTAAYQPPPPMGFSRQEYWSGVPLPSPGLNSRLCFLLLEGFNCI